MNRFNARELVLLITSGICLFIFLFFMDKSRIDLYFAFALFFGGLMGYSIGWDNCRYELGDFNPKKK